MGHYAKRFFGQKYELIKGNKLSLDAGNVLSYPGTGTTWYDLSGSGNNGTLVNGVAYSTTNGGVMSFDGVNDYVNCGTTLNIINSSTVCFFMKRDSKSKSGYETMISKRLSQLDINFQVYLDTTTKKLSFARGSSGTATGFNTNYIPNLNQWIYIAMVSSANTVSLYANGVLLNVFSTTLGVSLSGNIVLGAGFSGTKEFFKGQLNNIDIYDYAITAQQIYTNFKVLKSKYGL